MDQDRARPLPDKENAGAPENAGASAADCVAVDTELGMEWSGRWREVGRVYQKNKTPRKVCRVVYAGALWASSTRMLTVASSC